MQERLEKLHTLDKNKTFVVSNTENLAFEDMPIYENIINQYKNKFIVSYIGGVGFHRGIDTTIKAFNQIKEKDIYLLIVGGIDKSIKQYLESISKNQNIIYTGQVPFKNVPSYIKASNICLVPHNNTEHTNNTIPHKLFQYMLLKKLVIVSDCPPLKDVIDECKCGAVFKRDDEINLRDKIINIYNYKGKLSEIGLNGYNCVQRKYNFEEDAKNLIKMYKEIYD
jgi:glycosyltransferase involved in cell wall biosynthesis